MKYDYLIVGGELYGSAFTRQAVDAGKKVLVIDKRSDIVGNVYTEDIEEIQIHKYGAYIFHTNSKAVWDYMICFATFNRFTNYLIANYHGEIDSMPFNMYTLNKMWGIVTPEEAIAKIVERKLKIKGDPQNLEEQAISLVGSDIYERLVKGYTKMIVKMLESIEVRLNEDYIEKKLRYDTMKDTVVYIGGLIGILTISLEHWNIFQSDLKMSF